MNPYFRRGVRLLDAYVNISGHNCYAIEEFSKEIALVTSLQVDSFDPFLTRLRFLEPLRLRRILDDLTYAAKQRLVYHLWWHPHNFGQYTEDNSRFSQGDFGSVSDAETDVRHGKPEYARGGPIPGSIVMNRL